MSNMIHTTILTNSQKQDIHFLEVSCKAAEPLSLSAPVEDGLDYFLYYREHRLVGMAYLFFPESTLCECSGFVLPELRQQGIFSALLDDMTDFLEKREHQLNEEIDFCFLCDRSTPSAKPVLNALECELWYSEHQMERSLSCSRNELFHSPEHAPIHLFSKSNGNDSCTFAAVYEQTEIGTCQLHFHGRQVYFYGFEIQESCRNKGYGTQFLQMILEFLTEQGYESVRLQVSGSNAPALSLYKKTGFHITETLSYYWY